MIDQEVQAIINEQYKRAKSILKEHTSGHNMLAQVLLEREVIYTEDVEHIFGKRAWVSRSEEILELQEKANGQKAEEAKVAEAEKQKDDTNVTTSDSKTVNV